MWVWKDVLGCWSKLSGKISATHESWKCYNTTRITYTRFCKPSMPIPLKSVLGSSPWKPGNICNWDQQLNVFSSVAMPLSYAKVQGINLKSNVPTNLLQIPNLGGKKTKKKSTPCSMNSYDSNFFNILLRIQIYVVIQQILNNISPDKENCYPK